MSAEVVPYVPQVALSTADALELVRRIDEAKKLVMREHVDYGRVPGTDRPSLLKPGAERLLQLFALGHRMRIVETERDPDGPVAPWAVTVECEVVRSGEVVGSCLGYASYDEDRFYRPAREPSDTPETGERIPGKKAYKAPWNTLLKMAQKRALVGAALQVTGSSGLFTQDVDDEGTRAVEVIRAVCRDIVKSQDKATRDALNAVAAPSPEWGVTEWASALVTLGRLLGPVPE